MNAGVMEAALAAALLAARNGPPGGVSVTLVNILGSEDWMFQVQHYLLEACRRELGECVLHVTMSLQYVLFV